MTAPLRRAVQRLSRLLKDLLFPQGRACLLCRQPTRQQSLCSACLETLRRQQLSAEEQVLQMDAALTVCSAFPYAGAARRLVLLLKFEPLEEAGQTLAFHLASVLCSRGLTADVVTWVPMPARRRRQRGIDHGQLLAQEVAASLNLPCLPLLRRSAGAQAEQHRLTRAQRLLAAPHAFQPLEGAQASGLRVLLVDDVHTTGATVCACAQQLTAMGAVSVLAATVCRTGTQDESTKDVLV